MLRSSKALIDFVKISELYRKGFSEKLREALSLNDELKNQIFELDQNKKLTLISYEIIQKKLHMLYESMTEISNAKNLEDKFLVESERKTKLIRLLNDEKKEMSEQLTLEIAERD